MLNGVSPAIVISLKNNFLNGIAAIDKFIRQTQLFINHPNCYAEWIPYEQFTNVTYIGSGGFATVYSATCINGLCTWKKNPTQKHISSF